MCEDCRGDEDRTSSIGFEQNSIFLLFATFAPPVAWGEQEISEVEDNLRDYLLKNSSYFSDALESESKWTELVAFVRQFLTVAKSAHNYVEQYIAPKTR